MAAVTVTGSRPYAQLRSTTPATPDDLREVVLLDWTRAYTVEAPVGGANLKVALVGTDGAAIGAVAYVDVYVGTGPRPFIASEGRERAQYTSIYIASLTADAPFVIEAEAKPR